MRKLLNTLYVTTPDAYLSKDGLNVVVSVKQEEVFRIPIVNIESVITFGYTGASPGLMKLCSDYGVSLAFMSPNGRFIGRMQGPTKGNVVLRQTQYERSNDDAFALALSRIMISGKIHNSRNVLKRCLRDHGSNHKIESAVRSLEFRKISALRAETLDGLRGHEGEAAAEYFGVFSELILNQREDFAFTCRTRHPPKDAFNALLSFSYALLANDVQSALEAVGLDPYVGFMHTVRPGRASLALDMMEELRAYLGDRLALSLINRRQVCIKDFICQTDESVVMTDNCRRTVIQAWQKRKKELMTHPFLNEKIPVGLLPYAQAMLLARFLRGDLDNYPVFLML